MKFRQWIVAFVLLVLVAAAVMGGLWTRPVPEPTDATSSDSTKKNVWPQSTGSAHSVGG
jgi:hypothetical protein